MNKMVFHAFCSGHAEGSSWFSPTRSECLPSFHKGISFQIMNTLDAVRPLAMSLSLGDRAELAGELLGSLPSLLQDDDDGVAEALAREAEAESNPSAVMTLAEFETSLGRMKTC
jgi:hypothetical protein